LFSFVRRAAAKYEHIHVGKKAQQNMKTQVPGQYGFAGDLPIGQGFLLHLGCEQKAQGCLLLLLSILSFFQGFLCS
jgi:hypothetical protein